jgi:hypothetical protein
MKDYFTVNELKVVGDKPMPDNRTRGRCSS